MTPWTPIDPDTDAGWMLSLPRDQAYLVSETGDFLLAETGEYLIVDVDNDAGWQTIPATASPANWTPVVTS